jgi:formamidopyrimidine-DNA glycosylase
MPELPELFLMSKFINDISMNIAYTHIEIPSDSKVKCDFDDLPSLFTISSESRGKELLISFSNYDKKLSMTMGMSGTFMYVDRKLQLAFPSLLKNIRFAFITASGSKLALVDHRRFAK